MEGLDGCSIVATVSQSTTIMLKMMEVIRTMVRTMAAMMAMGRKSPSCHLMGS